MVTIYGRGAAMVDEIRLMQGDCIEKMKQIPDGSVDMVLCDPPYGTTDNEWDDCLPLDPLWAEYKRICKKNAAILLFSQLPFSADLIVSNRRMFRYEWIWQKTMAVGFLNAKKMPLRAHENILVFYQALPVYNPQKTYGHTRPNIRKHNTVFTGNYGKQRLVDYFNTDGSRYPVDVIKISNGNYGSKHPTQKPVTLLEYLIMTYTNEGDTVLDNCMGSGSTGVACVHTKRRFIGIELNENYFNIASKRINSAEIGLFAG